MLIPIGHDEDKIRRQPWVTYGIMILCSLAFVLTHFNGQRRAAQGYQSLQQALEFYQGHPYLKLDSRLENLLRANGVEPDPGTGAGTPGLGAEFVSLEQVELDGLTKAGFDALAEVPQYRLGLVPAHFSLVGLVAHMFLHAGLLHLLGNMLFLYLSAPFLEDVWGRPFFAGFYLLGGMFAGVFFAVRYWGLDTSMIGASGAIAAVMGAFLVRHWHRKIRFFYWFGIVFRGTFSSPAWVILPLYFIGELLSAFSADMLAPGAGGGGVAYWAHVSGFGFGALAAAAMKWFRVEERWLAPALDAHLTVVHNPGLELALERRQQGRADEAWTVLWKEARQAPDNVDTVLALWDMAKESDRTAEAGPVLGRLVREQLQRGEAPDAYHNWLELRRNAPGVRVPPALEGKLAEALAAEGLRDEAAEVARAACDSAGADTAPGVLLRLARVGVGVDRAKVTALALRRPDLSTAQRAELEALAAGVSTLPGLHRETGAPRTPVAAPDGRRDDSGPISAVPAIPLGLEGTLLALQLPNGDRRNLDLRRIRAVGAAAVGGAGVEDTMILDLFLETGASSGGPVKAIRLDSHRFDPRRLIPAEQDPRDAFLSLAGAVVAASGAVWLLGLAATRLSSYPTAADYERDLCRALGLGR